MSDWQRFIAHVLYRAHDLWWRNKADGVWNGGACADLADIIFQ